MNEAMNYKTENGRVLVIRVIISLVQQSMQFKVISLMH